MNDGPDGASARRGPAARPAFPLLRRGRRPAGPAGPNAWESLRGWELLLAATTLLPASFIVLEGPRTPEHLLAAGLLAAVPVVYLLLGRPAITREDRPRGIVYIVLLAALFTPAVLIAPTATFALFGLCPQCFMVLRARPAVAGVVVFNLGPALRFTLSDDGWAGTFNFLTVTTIVVFFSAVFGVWLERIMEQSEERAALIAELEAQRAEVARLSAERGALAERERLAGEIHDTLAQGFTSIIMLLQAAEAQPDPARHLALAVRTARENLAEARGLIAALSPAPLDGSTLDEALRRLAARLGEETGIEAVAAVGGRSRPLPPPAEVVLIRAAQEALANVRKHAGASRVDVRAVYGPGTVTLEVRDDGIGLDPEAAGGYGLRGMRARAEQVGGTLTLTSAPGAGTVLTVTVPTGPAASPEEPARAAAGTADPGAASPGVSAPAEQGV
ncbi:histidine kinase [Planomonospora sphaerica]|uniref:Oxygen sensor histidine kinase NreB n=1 Tax=Planomonospora sphaerica TaxID=161355 RepID=A0A171BQL4_9ACTN|nr:sensor histidine kinase [Planomonospora sphaerica]GAT65438.1 histidine kinase [Planomonospora sphaerica]